MGKDAEVIPITKPEQFDKQKYSLFEILGFIEQLSFNERKGTAISEEAITTISFTRYIETGFKYSFVATFIITFVLPINFGAIDKVFPLFGSYDQKWYDVLFILFHSCFPSLGIALLAFAIFYKCFCGPVTLKAMLCLRRGFIWGKLVGTLHGWVVLQFIYFFIIKNPYTYYRIKKFISVMFSGTPYLGDKINWYIYHLGHSVVLASWFLIFIALVHIGILYLAVFISKNKTQNILKMRETWGLPSWISKHMKQQIESNNH